jgi:hypothetical protein
MDAMIPVKRDIAPIMQEHYSHITPPFSANVS